MSDTLNMQPPTRDNVSMTQQVAPDKTQLGRYLAEGLTQQQIVDAWEADSGVRVSRSTIAMAIDRYNLRSAHSRPRYFEMIPWEVKTEHAHHNDARMLRLEARRRQGGNLTEKEARILTAWRVLLDERNAVILYDPQTEQGWWWGASRGDR